MMRKEIAIESVGVEVSNIRMETLWQQQQWGVEYFYNRLFDPKAQDVLIEVLFVLIEQERYLVFELISNRNQQNFILQSGDLIDEI